MKEVLQVFFVNFIPSNFLPAMKKKTKVSEFRLPSRENFELATITFLKDKLTNQKCVFFLNAVHSTRKTALKILIYSVKR